MKRQPPLHPFFLALLPVLSVFSPHLGVFAWAQIYPPALFALGLAAVTLLPGLVLFRDLRKAALLATVTLAGGLFYMRGMLLFEQMPVLGPILARHRFAIPFYLLAVAGTAWWLRRTRRSLDTVTVLANVVTLGMLLLPGAQLGWFFATHPLPAWDPAAAIAADSSMAGAVRPAQPPDIWYIVPDRYGGQRTIREVCGFDNQEFYDYLESRNFYVAHDSFSNYPRTPFSLASSLNLEYLDEMAVQAGVDSRDWRPLYERIRRHKVGTFLNSLGYRRIHSGSWWWPTGQDPLADENLTYPAPPYGAVVLADLSVLAALRLRFKIEWFDEDLQQHRRLQYKFARIPELAGQPGPKFVFVHIIAPHPPYVMRPDGAYRDPSEAATMSEEALYCDQVLAVNRLLAGMIDRILAESPSPPVILLQSDEGPWFNHLGKLEVDFTWETISRRNLRIKTSILNAYHLPGMDRTALDPAITPVNSFRLIFNHYFGAGLEKLPDRLYLYESEGRPYRLHDVTARLEER